jgi:hypothetical protein
MCGGMSWSRRANYLQGLAGREPRSDLGLFVAASASLSPPDSMFRVPSSKSLISIAAEMAHRTRGSGPRCGSGLKPASDREFLAW